MTNEKPITSLPKKGYRLAKVSLDNRSFCHHLCGPTTLRQAISPNSGRSLLCLLSLDTKDTRLELDFSPEPRIELLYSWTCAIPEGDFFYRICSGSVDIISFRSGPGYADFPFANYPDSFPEIPVNLLEVSSEEEFTARLLNKKRDFATRSKYKEFSIPYHQIGGEPVFVQDYVAMVCPICKEEMAFFASIGNDNGQPLGFCDNEFVQVIYQVCKECSIFGVYNCCD
jgi:hypothetical protein